MTPRFESIRDKFPAIKYVHCPIVGRDRATVVCETMSCAEGCRAYQQIKEANHDTD